MFREAVVKNSFYPNDVNVLEDFFKKYSSQVKKDAVGAICPHAGYVYSGRTAVKVLGGINIPGRVIILNPNHTGAGKNLSVYTSGSWESPFGDVKIDTEATEFLLKQELFEKDVYAHLNEHSAEVMIPILKYFNPDVKIIPVAFKYISLKDCETAANGICNLLKIFPDTLLLMSSDMNHFENDKVSRQKDEKAIEKILKSDADGLYNVVAKYRISMCGVIPVTIGIKAMLKAYNKIKPEIVEYTNSGEVSGDFSSVVGYLGVTFHLEDISES